MAELNIGILTVSDSCFNGTNEDKSGPNLKNLLMKNASIKISEDQIIMQCVPDEYEPIKKALLEWADDKHLSLILTTGGTGFSPRDITPEVTKSVLDREAPGLTIAMITESLQITPMAMLSRPSCGIRKSTLIVNLPGSRKGSQECLEFILPSLNHALDLLKDSVDFVKATHRIIQQSSAHVCPHGHRKDHTSVAMKGGGRAREDFYPVTQRPRESPYPMLPVNEAIDIILTETPCTTASNTIELDLHSSLHYVLAADVKARYPLPPFPASIKDGYAVISSDGSGERNVLKPIIAGDDSSVVTVTPGNVARITTGAPLPQGADAVVMVENTKLVSTSEDGTEERIVDILVPSKPGQDIRPIGSDMKEGEIILEHKTIIGPSEIGIAAGAGIDRLSVYKAPVVAVLSTGNEVIEPGIGLKPGQIYDSNRYSLLSLLKEWNCKAVDMGIAKDTRDDLVEQMGRALDEADVLITSGGVSMGEMDLLKPVLVKDFNATIHFGRVFMKPGKPTTFASLERNNKKKLVFALPGNPVSAMVTFELFVLPALKKLSGRTQTTPFYITTKVMFPIHLDPRPEYHRVKLVWFSEQGKYIAESTGTQTSSRLMNMKGANGLLILPPRTDQQSIIAVGETVTAIHLAHTLL